MRALITGGADGLGAALVEQLSGQGARICVLDIKAPAPGPNIAHIAVDLARTGALPSVVEQLEREGPFELVVLSAGISAVGAFETVPIADSLEVVAVNALAPILLIQQLLSRGQIADGGRIVFVSSLSHFVGYPGASAYAASKDALVGFARSIRRVLHKRYRINVQVAVPGPMRTAHAERYAPPGSSGRGRIAPEAVARTLLGPRRGFWIVPGASARAMVVFGRLFPGAAARLMRKMIYERLA